MKCVNQKCRVERVPTKEMREGRPASRKWLNVGGKKRR